MNLLQIVDLGKGQIEVAWRCDNAIPRHYSPLPFQDPLSTDDRGELRWYLEEYLQFPYGAEESHARRVEGKMAEWGEALFSQAFPKVEADPDPRGFYQEAVRAGLEQCELCINAEDTEFLNVPWELIRDPTPGRGYLAPSLGGLYRQRSGQAIRSPLDISHDEPFRILLIIARPLGEEDIPLGTVSRPMLEALRPLRPRVQLEVLRPPTFDALVTRLEDSPGFYHLVHFDGHGVFAPSGSAPAMAYGAKLGRGHLVFENADGTPHVVNSEDLGQALANSKVPLFVLNACQSAQEGKADAYSSVAAQLVAIGAKGVVAMSYSVYADAAALFMERFYEKLVGGASLSAAVAAGRKRLFAQPHRASVVGNLELRDWMVPALYQQEQGYIPIPRAEPVTVAEEETGDALQLKRAEEVCPEGRFGFIFRDYDILRIDRALQDDSSPWVLLSGMGGIGKTELAYGFARWYAETGGCPRGVFATSFKEKADFGQVMGSIFGYGTGFSRIPKEAQWQHLVGYLRHNACLLVWDNFETVTGYPRGAEPLATAEDRDALNKLVKALRGGKTRLLIASRKPDERWLEIAPQLVELRGLTKRDAGLLARQVLKTVGRKPEDFRQDPRYMELIDLLRGHPRSVELVLPHLRNRSPAELIEAIQHRVDDLGESLEDASLTYAFHQLSEKARKHLPILGLFVSRVDAYVLELFVTSAKQTYVELVGEQMDATSWEVLLDDADGCGVLSSLGGHVYELHPTLPPFLRGQLVSSVKQEGLKRLNAEFLRFYAQEATAGLHGVREGSSGYVTTVRVEEGNFLRALRLAEMEGQWVSAQAVAQILREFYELSGRTEEWVALRVRLLGKSGRDTPPASDRERAGLWMYLVGDEANSALQANRLDVAEQQHHRVLDFLLALGDPAVERNIGVAYHELGRIAQERSQFDDAEELYRKALEIFERLGLDGDTADEYHHLGMIAQERNRFEEAEDCYRKALDIFEQSGLHRRAATSCHELGRIAQGRHRFDEAERWYRKALEMYERQGLELDAAGVYHQLGRVAQERDRFHEAERWYRRALEIFERRGVQRDAALVYHQLGRVVEARGGLDALDEAEQWYRRALRIREHLRLEADAAGDYHQLGIIAQQRNRLEEAEKWYRMSLEIKERLALHRAAASDYHELGIIAQLRQRFDQAEGWYRKALDIYERLDHPPLTVSTLAQLGLLRRDQNRPRDAVSWLGRALAIATEYEMTIAGQVLADLARLLRSMDEDDFTVAWKEVFEAEEPPLELLRQVLKRLDDESG